MRSHLTRVALFAVGGSTVTVWIEVAAWIAVTDRGDGLSRGDGVDPGDGVDQGLRRRAARVICLDPLGRVLLLRWRDPGNGQLLWEPPGGGVEAGESDLEAAHRELDEETGLSGDLDEAWAVEVERDFYWNGKRFVGPERFYGLEVAEASTARPAALTESETSTFLGSGWFSVEELAALPDRVEPAELSAVMSALAELRHAGDV